MEFLKVIYFDENSALDYLDLKEGGRFYFNEENVDNLNKQLEGESQAGIKAGTSIPFLNLLFSAKAKGAVSKQGDKLIQTTLSNTVLTDFVNDIKGQLHQESEESSIKILSNTKATIYKDSYAYLSVITPFTHLLEDKTMKMDDWDIDLGKVDEVLENAKGYYELLGEQKDKEFVLRFNSRWFRNNYRIFDLEQMDLTYLGIKVGTCWKEDLKLENQLPVDQSNKNSKSQSDIIEELIAEDEELKELVKETKPEQEASERKRLDIYDVLLAGVSNE